MGMKTNDVYDLKCKEFLNKNAIDAFKTKTPRDKLPIIFLYGSSSHNPKQKVGVETCDIVLWVKFLDKWFKPYGRFDQTQIEKMIEVCINDNQVLALFELLSAE